MAVAACRLGWARIGVSTLGIFDTLTGSEIRAPNLEDVVHRWTGSRSSRRVRGGVLREASESRGTERDAIQGFGLVLISMKRVN